MKRAEYLDVAARAFSEDQLQSQITEAATVLGWLWYHTHNSRRSPAGFPDLVLVRGDRVIFAELKVWNKKPTEKQERWLGALDATAAEVYVWRPQDWLDGTVRDVLMGRAAQRGEG